MCFIIHINIKLTVERQFERVWNSIGIKVFLSEMASPWCGMEGIGFACDETGICE